MARAGEPSDEALLLAMARREADALAAFYDRHAGSLLAAANAIVRERRESEDVVHDTLLEVWSKAREFDPARGSARGWVLLRLRSRALDRVRARQRARAELPEIAEPAARDDEVWQDRVSLRGALARLSPEQRRVIELGYYEGLSSSEIANRLGLPLGTVKSRVAAALAVLRGALADGAVSDAGAADRRGA